MARAMSLAPHPRSMTADLLRLLAAWLAVIVFVQGFAAARALGLGPLHQHDAAWSSATMARGHHHEAGERHHHAPGDPGVVHEAAELDLGAFALTAALGLLAFAAARGFADRRLHVLSAAPVWAWCTCIVRRPLRPPRALRA